MKYLKSILIIIEVLKPRLNHLLKIYNRMNIISTSLMGGLGNMMFQISTAYSISLRDNKSVMCDIRNMSVPHKPYSEYTSNIFRKVKFTNYIENLTNFNEEGFHYSDIPKTQGNVKLVGYFQSEKYFINYRNEILELFEIDEITKKILVQKYGNLSDKKTCSIHVRRGDYTRLTDYHPTQSIDYYKTAVKILGEDNYYLIFSDDLLWCQENFDFIPNKIFVSDNLDYQDLYLMSMCKDNIIANSTFSWWGAWLNKNNEKKVFIPKRWFGDAYSSFNTNDLYCNNWIKI